MKNIKMNFRKMFNIMSVLKRASKPYYYLIFISNLFVSIRPFVSIIFTRLIIDGLINKAPQEDLYLYIIGLIGLNFFIGIILRFIGYLQKYYSVKLNYNLNNLIALKSFELDYEQIEANEVMNLIQKAKDGSNSSGGIVSYGDYLVGNLIVSSLTFVYSITLLSGLFVRKELNTTSKIAHFFNHPASLLIILVVIVIVAVVNMKIMKKDNKRSYDAMMGNIDGNRKFSYFYRLASNYKYGKDIRINNMQPMILEAMQSEKYSVDRVWREYTTYNIRYTTIITLMGEVLSFCAYVFVGIKALYGMISIGNVVAYASAITLFSQKINEFISTYANISLRNNYLDNYFEYLNLQTKHTYGDLELDANEEIEIEFKDLSFAYPNQNNLILKNINLKITKGKKIAIVGANGAGKTTLIKLLCRLYQPTSGDIYINGRPISEYSKEACYQLFSVVFQDFKLFSYSIKNNVASGLEVDEEKVWDSLEKAGLKEQVQKMEDGLDTIIYQRNRKNGVEISGGEAQKLAIARALYKDAPLVILDEPTAALDPKSEAEIYEKFKDLVHHKTAIFISHRMSSCKFCDEIVVLDDGEIKEIGNHQELLNQNGIYKKMWNAQAKYYQ